MLWKYENSTKSLVLLFFYCLLYFLLNDKKKVNKQMSQSVQSREKNKWIGLNSDWLTEFGGTVLSGYKMNEWITNR